MTGIVKWLIEDMLMVRGKNLHLLIFQIQFV